MSNLVIIKRDGKEEKFNSDKLIQSLEWAAKDVKQHIDETSKYKVLSIVLDKVVKDNKEEKIHIEKLQDFIQSALYIMGLRLIRDAYVEYRKNRSRIRETKTDIMTAIKKIGVHTDKDNGNVGNNFGAKLLRIASEANKWQNLANMPKELSKAHEIGDFHLHDLDSWNLTINCFSHTLDPIKNGFKATYGTIRPAKRIETAAELACIMLQASQNQFFGGQAMDDWDNDMAYFVKLSRQEIRKEYEELLGKEHPNLDTIVEEKLEKTVQGAMQSFMYNLSTMESRSGSQIVFSSVNIGLPVDSDAAMVCKHTLIEYGKGLGNGEQLIFPNVVFAVKEGVNKRPEDPYYYLYQIACEVASRRLNPTFLNIDATYNLKYYEQGIRPSTMGCRTTVVDNINGRAGAAKRGNIAPTTINLPRLGIEARLHQQNTGCTEAEKIEFFFSKLNDLLELTAKSLLYRFELLKNLKGKDMPFITENNLYMDLEIGPEDSIEPILRQGSYGIGFIGLHETLIALSGKHHGESLYCRELGDSIIRTIREFADETKVKTGLNFSCYGSPAEGLSGRFAPMDRARYGTIAGVTDKDYYTNSYHVNPGYKIAIKDKIQIEAPYHELCNGGRISYIELDDYPSKEEIERIVTWSFTNTNISYIGINFHVRYCTSCSHLLGTEDECPKCGSRKIQGVSRITGYLALDERFGKGKFAERADRVAHNNESDEKIYKNINSEA